MKRLPLVYACAGCSVAGRLAYELAQEFDRRGIAEMSCLAGVGAGKAHFVKQLEGREVWIIDGCPIECSLGVFAQVRCRADVHIRLHELGVKKHSGAPPGWDMERLLDAAAKQVSEQREFKQHPPAGEGPASPATKSQPSNPRRGRSDCNATLAASQHTKTVSGKRAYSFASQS